MYLLHLKASWQYRLLGDLITLIKAIIQSIPSLNYSRSASHATRAPGLKPSKFPHSFVMYYIVYYKTLK